MKKIQIVSLVLLVACALSAFAAASASALESGWLVNNEGALKAEPATVKGLHSLDILIAGVLADSLDCEWSLDGTVGSELGTRFDSITEVLDKNGKVVNSTNPLACKVETSALEGCGKVGESASVVPVDLPWETEVTLSGSTFLDLSPVNLGLGSPGYLMVCPGSAKKEIECTGPMTLVLSNGTSTVLGVFNESENEATCGEGVGHLGGEGTIEVAGKTLSVSEGE